MSDEIQKRVRAVREVANTIANLSDEELAKVVGGAGTGPGGRPLPDWWNGTVAQYIDPFGYPR